MLSPENLLKRHWGYTSFRSFQKETIDAVLSGRDVMSILPTGCGKSICYQIPALTGRGLVVVISPLIALMDDQVASAREAGINAAALHSNLSVSRKKAVRAALYYGTLQLLYVSPERLLAKDFEFGLLKNVFLFAVDEAHCVSQWGHEFRPEYRQLANVFGRHPKAVRMALTATATPDVRRDILEQLSLRHPESFIGYPDRPNLTYRAYPCRDRHRQVLETIRRHPGEGGIVYAQTRRTVENLTMFLSGYGVSCAAYHAGLPAAERAAVQSAFVNEKIDVIVATIAFGMGIDRPNVRYVIHANTPKSMENYSQESGRAGRDGLPAECILLFSAQDMAIHRFLAEKEGLNEERIAIMERQLRDMGRYAISSVCRHKLLCEHFGVKYPDIPAKYDDNGNEIDSEYKCGSCDVCLGEINRLPEDYARLTAKKILSAVWRLRGQYGVGYIADILMGRSCVRAVQNGHDRLNVFGILKSCGMSAVRYWIDQLIVQGFIRISGDDRYPLASITPEGRALCRDELTVVLGVPQEEKRTVVSNRRDNALERLGYGSMRSEDEKVFDRLRMYRRLIADRQGVPPYIIVPDSTLAELATIRPKSIEEMEFIKGMGERRIAKYGGLFLEVIEGKPIEDMDLPPA